MNKHISIVIPVYNEALNLPRLYERLDVVTSKLPEYAWEYIFINDGSSDHSFQVLREIAKGDPKVKAFDLSRNFGKEIALTAGAHEAKYADAVICIDADLQHPPELIPTLIEKWQAGAEVVVTIRVASDREPLFRKWGSDLYYWLMNKFASYDVIPKATDFRLYDRKVIAAFCLTTERERMFRGIMDWMGFKREFLEFTADARVAGNAGYSYPKLWRLAVTSLTSFSLWPLRLTGYLGVLISGCSALLLFWMVGNYLLKTKMFYTPLAIFVVANTLLMGVVLMAIGLVALYVGTIHTEVINRPLFIIRDQVNGTKNKNS